MLSSFRGHLNFVKSIKAVTQRGGRQPTDIPVHLTIHPVRYFIQYNMMQINT